MACSADLFIAWIHFSSQSFKVSVVRPKLVNLLIPYSSSLSTHAQLRSSKFHILLSVLQGTGVDVSIPDPDFSYFLKQHEQCFLENEYAPNSVCAGWFPQSAGLDSSCVDISERFCM